MFSLTGLLSSWEQPDCPLWDNQPAPQPPRPREVASPMAGRAHPDYEADVVKISAIICGRLNPFNAEYSYIQFFTPSL